MCHFHCLERRERALAVVLLVAVFVAYVGGDYEIGKENTMSDEGEVEDGRRKGVG